MHFKRLKGLPVCGTTLLALECLIFKADIPNVGTRDCRSMKFTFHCLWRQTWQRAEVDLTTVANTGATSSKNYDQATCHHNAIAAYITGGGYLNTLQRAVLRTADMHRLTHGHLIYEFQFGKLVVMRQTILATLNGSRWSCQSFNQ